MKIQIIIEHKPLTSGKSTKKIIEDIASMVEELSKRHPETIYPHLVEVTVTEKRG